MDLARKLQELIKEVQKYIEEQAKAHKKVRSCSNNKSVMIMLFNTITKEDFLKDFFSPCKPHWKNID